MNEIERIANQINLAYHDGFWGGGSIRDLFRSFSASEAASHPLSGTHSTWEIALHLAVWHNIFHGRITGKDVEYIYETDWPKPLGNKEIKWTSALDDLDQAHEALVDAARNLEVKELYNLVSGKRFTFYEMLPRHFATRSLPCRSSYDTQKGNIVNIREITGQTMASRGSASGRTFTRKTCGMNSYFSVVNANLWPTTYASPLEVMQLN